MKFQSRVPEPGWETLSAETHFSNPHLTVATVEVRSPAKPRPHRWTVAHRKAAVIIAPMTAEGKLVLIRQERVPIEATIWEVPGGQVDEAGELPAALEAVARRELQEETGYELAPDGEFLPLGHYFSSPGFTDERGYFFLARPVVPSADGPAHTDSEAILDCRAFSPGELTRMIAQNEIRDANTLSICAQLAARGILSLQR